MTALTSLLTGRPSAILLTSLSGILYLPPAVLIALILPSLTHLAMLGS
jgi:hypothetical protein